MKTREEILSLLAKDKPELESRFKVKKLALFGSYARGEQHGDSDVDILVEVYEASKILTGKRTTCLHDKIIPMSWLSSVMIKV